MTKRTPLPDNHHNCLFYPLWIAGGDCGANLAKDSLCYECDYDDGPDNFVMAPIPWGELTYD